MAIWNKKLKLIIRIDVWYFSFHRAMNKKRTKNKQTKNKNKNKKTKQQQKKKKKKKKKSTKDTIVHECATHTMQSVFVLFSFMSRWNENNEKKSTLN